jgi:hypothetical protein
MAYETYSSIVTLVKSWSNRRDLTDENFYNFIYFAGNMANQILRVPAMENTVILEVSPDGHLVIPYDFLELRSLTALFNDQLSVPLERIAWDQFINYKQDDLLNNETNPMYFARQGAYWFLTPQPAAGSKVTCHYYRSMPDVNVDEQENWLTNLSPMTYVFGALHFLYLYLMDDDRAQYWLDKFNGELARLQSLADDAEYKGTSLTIRNRDTDRSGDL